MKTPKKKRQHYVPRFLLKKFAVDENRRQIRLLLLKEKKAVDKASIADQCYKDYFYGKDEAIEDIFAEVEGKVSRLLSDLSQGALERLNREDLLQIKYFVYYQKYRTAGCAEYEDDLFNSLSKKLITDKFSEKKADDIFIAENLGRVKFRLINPQIDSIITAVKLSPLILDLNVKFLLCRENSGFVVSDDPVVFYNQFIEHNRHLQHCQGSTGLAVKGLQMFLPISPHVCIAIYDPSTYRYGSHTTLSCFVSSRDVLMLNKLQALYARRCVYYDTHCTAQHREQIMSVRGQYNAHDPIVHEKVEINAKRFIQHWCPDVRIGAKFSFAQVIDSRSFKAYAVEYSPVRSPRLHHFVEHADEFFEQFRKSQRNAAACVGKETSAADKHLSVRPGFSFDR